MCATNHLHLVFSRRSLVDGMEVIVTSLPCNLIGQQEGRTYMVNTILGFSIQGLL